MKDFFICDVSLKNEIGVIIIGRVQTRELSFLQDSILFFKFCN